jgi:very-short-patch-repair endonuclease
MLKTPNAPLPPTPSPLRSEGEPRQNNTSGKDEALFASTPSEEGSSENVIYTRTTLEIWDKIKPLARQMRRESTPAEDALWQQLRRKNMGSYKFRRQHPIDRFIVDFFCREAHLVVEVDGAIHEYTAEEDALRTEFLESRGLQVIRFTNDEVLQNMDGVLQSIRETIANIRA